MMQADGRRFVPERRVRARRRGDGLIELSAPMPGLFRGGPREGATIAPDDILGELEVLGVLHRLRVPSDAYGTVVEVPRGRRLARRPVDCGAMLVVLDPEGAREHRAAPSAVLADESSGGPVFRTPLGGRYYARPAPNAEPFVKVGDVIATGTTVALIEVMKTFYRVRRVLAIARADGDDVEPGDALLELEAVE
jgi:acetyl-CoA carboxylase biotin carboxyl carrier protein